MPTVKWIATEADAARATFAFGGKAWDVWDAALLGWDYDSQEVHGITGADGSRISIAVTY